MGKKEAFDKAWAKLAALPQNQAKCYLVKGNQVTLECTKYPWYGKNEAECLEFIKK